MISVCHAEMNAILNKNQAECSGSTIYTTLYPCNECAKLIIQSGIENVIHSFIDIEHLGIQISKLLIQISHSYIQFTQHQLFKIGCSRLMAKSLYTQQNEPYKLLANFL